MTEDRAAPADQLTDSDGTRLLYTEEVARALGIAVTTVRWKNADARRQRKRGRKPRFPAPRKHVQRTTLKANGQPVTVTTPVWRQDRIEEYLANQLGPGGRPAATLRKRAS
ncbi:MAG TPA: hypothetical protein VHT94_07265 [Streptosporangiaceae bacterium]|nr:hypothetical protein [Streptosporangiaceae bacterium]